jgi:hypothetical protein
MGEGVKGRMGNIKELNGDPILELAINNILLDLINPIF